MKPNNPSSLFLPFFFSPNSVVSDNCKIFCKNYSNSKLIIYEKGNLSYGATVCISSVTAHGPKLLWSRLAMKEPLHSVTYSIRYSIKRVRRKVELLYSYPKRYSHIVTSSFSRK